MRSLAVAVLVTVLQAPACASDWTAADGRLRHGELGLSLADPATRAGWQRAEVEGAELAYRGPDGAMMSFLRGCDVRGDVEVSPRQAARQLLLGLEERRLEVDRALQVAGAPAWLQVVEARDETREARLKTVTRVAPPCREDWVLSSPGAFGAAEEVFDAWWRSFRPPPGGEGDSDGAGPAAGADAP